MFHQRKKHPIAPAVFLLLLLSVGMAPSLLATPPVDLLVNHFAHVDSLFAGTAGTVAGARFDSSLAYTAFRDLLHLNPELYALIAFDKRSKPVAAGCFEQLAGGFKDSLPLHNCYRKARKSKSAVYGGFTKINGRVCLVWCRPCLRKNRLGLTTYGGAVIALVNVAECLKTFSADFGLPFELVLGERVIYHSDDWNQDSSIEESRFELAEGLIFTLRSGSATTPCSAIPSLPAIAAGTGPVVYNDPSGCGVVAAVIIAALAALGALAFAHRRRLSIPILERIRRFVVAGGNRPAAIDRYGNGITVRRQVVEDLRLEIRSKIEKYEIAAMENDIREKCRRELRARFRQEMTDDEREALRREAYEEEKESLRSSAVHSLELTEKSRIVDEVRSALREKIVKEVRREETTRLREEVKREMSVKFAAPIEAFVEESPVAAHLTVSTSSSGSIKPESRPHPVASEAIESLVRTVDSLQKQRRGFPLFSLDEAQTSLMIDYLEKISQRLGGPFRYDSGSGGEHSPCLQSDLGATAQVPAASVADRLIASGDDSAFSGPSFETRTGTDE